MTRFEPVSLLDRQRYICLRYIRFIATLLYQTDIIFHWDNILLNIINMKICIILLCLLAVVYSEEVGNDKSFQQHKDLIMAKIDDTKDIISSFFSNLLEPASLQGLVTQLVEWILYLLFTVIVAQLSA